MLLNSYLEGCVLLDSFISGIFEQINQMPVWGIYLFLFLSGFLQVIFAPYPGEVILVFSGYLGTLGEYRGLFLFISYWSAIIICNFIIYELGLRYCQRILNSNLVRRAFPRERLEKSKKWVQKYGFFVYIIAIFIPGMYLPTVFISGILAYRRYQAYLGMVVATLVHDVMLYISGSVLGGNWEKISQFLSMYKTITVLVIAAAVAAVVIYKLTAYFVKRQKSENIEP
ncbi:MAG TPA: hypothetical protein GXX36_02265 [Clostridiaceae bacterium]|nr:hypothetical protein [Clostridiaceae bacterium]